MKRLEKSAITIDFVSTDGKPAKGVVFYVKSGYKYFHNAQHLLLQLERGERALYDFLCEKMDTGNSIVIDRELRANFIAFVDRVTSQTLSYTDNSITKYVQKLSTLGLILKEGAGNSAYYVVNPKYAFVGPESARKPLLKKLIEDRLIRGESIQALIDRPENEFLSGK